MGEEGYIASTPQKSCSMQSLQRAILAVVVIAIALTGCGGGSAGAPFPPAPPTLIGPSLALAPAVSGQFVTSVSLVGCTRTCFGTSQTVDYPITVAPTVAGQALGVSVSIDVTSYSLYNTLCACSIAVGGLALPSWQLVSPSGMVYQGQSPYGPGECYAVGCAWNISTVAYYDGATLPALNPSTFTYFFSGSSFGGPSQPGTWHLVISSSGVANCCTGSASWLVNYTIQQGP